MNPLTNTQAIISNNPQAYTRSKDNHCVLPNKNQPRQASRMYLPLGQLLKRSKEETSLITNLAGNYYHAFIHSLFTQFNQTNSINLLYESHYYEIQNLCLEIALPAPFHKDIWVKKNQITTSLLRGSITLDNKRELFFYFSFLNSERTSIEILDIPFIMLILVEIHQNEMQAFLQGENVEGDTEQLPFDIKYELSSFKIITDYLTQRGGIEQGKVSIREF